MPNCRHIDPPGSVDGGDICEADGHFLIGVSARTNADGARQLAQHLARWGYASSILDIRSNPSLLHLKSGIAYLGDGVWVADRGIEAELRSERGIEIRDLIVVPAAEAYAANCVRVNGAVLVAAGYPLMSARTRAPGQPRDIDRGIRIQKNGRRLELPVAAVLTAAAAMLPPGPQSAGYFGGI